MCSASDAGLLGGDDALLVLELGDVAAGRRERDAAGDQVVAAVAGADT
jgi:hypothetical protein